MPDVESSVIRSIRYEATERRLSVTFRAGTVYRYEDVPEAEYEAFLAAESKGRFFTNPVLWSKLTTFDDISRRMRCFLSFETDLADADSVHAHHEKGGGEAAPTYFIRQIALAFSHAARG